MKTSQVGVDLIKKFEGFKRDAYRCPAGRWTIGYGTTHGVTAGMSISVTEAEDMLREHLQKDEAMLTALQLGLTQAQFDALMSFIYNVGFSGFVRSGLLKAIKKDKTSELVASEWMKWTKAGGKDLPGLVVRRKAELEVYFKD
jgi:lysozyme